MSKLWTTQCYSIHKLNRSLRIFPEFPLSAMIFQEISLSFPGLPRFFKFPLMPIKNFHYQPFPTIPDTLRSKTIRLAHKGYQGLNEIKTMLVRISWILTLVPLHWPTSATSYCIMSSMSSSFQYHAKEAIKDDTTAWWTMVKSVCQLIWPTTIQGVYTY